MPLLPTFNHEKLYWQAGVHMIAGVDEAGMGALAGPVCAGSVIFDNTFEIQIESLELSIRDSKTLSAKQREKAAEWIKEYALAWAVGEASVDEIDEHNIRQASLLAMRRAVDALQISPDMILIDGRPAQPHVRVPAVNIIDGDALSFSIAAASILAKVQRDSTMQQLDSAFPKYGFASHKGYGSAAHLAALQEFGPCEHHRKSYAPVASASPIKVGRS